MYINAVLLENFQGTQRLPTMKLGCPALSLYAKRKEDKSLPPVACGCVRAQPCTVHIHMYSWLTSWFVEWSWKCCDVFLESLAGVTGARVGGREEVMWQIFASSGSSFCKGIIQTSRCYRYMLGLQITKIYCNVVFFIVETCQFVNGFKLGLTPNSAAIFVVKMLNCLSLFTDVYLTMELM